MPDFLPPKTGGLFLNDEELDRLQDLLWSGYPFAYVLYVQEIRRYMDRATGVVGDRRKVCEQGMRETLEREAKRGPNGTGKKRSRDFVQRQISALQKFGLVERLPKGGQFLAMRFYLPLAVPGLNRPQEMRTVMHTVMHTDKTRKNPVVTDASERFANKNAQQSAQQCAHHQEEITTTTETGVFTLDQLAAVDMEMVVGSYHEMLRGLPRLRVATEGHRLLVARVWFMPPEGKHQTVDFWRAYFGACAKSDFLMGRIVPNQRKGAFRANFKSLVEPDRVLKIINGEYT